MTIYVTPHTSDTTSSFAMPCGTLLLTPFLKAKGRTTPSTIDQSLEYVVLGLGKSCEKIRVKIYTDRETSGVESIKRYTRGQSSSG